MADLNKALEILFSLEFKDESDALHKNKGENGLTFLGVYQTANPNASLWNIVNKEIDRANGDLKIASKEVFKNKLAIDIVNDIYRNNYWDRAKLSSVISQKIADEIFVFGVNVGMTNAIKKAQKLVGVEADGVVGPMTLKALNEYDENKFDYVFDYIEELFYSDLIAENPSLARFKNGWENRANSV